MILIFYKYQHGPAPMNRMCREFIVSPLFKVISHSVWESLTSGDNGQCFSGSAKWPTIKLKGPVRRFITPLTTAVIILRGIDLSWMLTFLIKLKRKMYMAINVSYGSSSNSLLYQVEIRQCCACSFFLLHPENQTSQILPSGIARTCQT